MTRQLLVLIWAAALFYNLNMTTCNDCVNWFHGSCTSNPCYNGGCCASLDNYHFNCTCKPGWTGKTCQDDDHCLGQHCLNGGTCINEKNSFRCDCPIGWTGQDCSTAVHTTETSTTTDASSFGKECTQYHGYCSGNPCFNGGCCTSLDNEFKCTCKPGWTGKTCQEERNECSRDNPCENGGACVDQKCTCPQGWTGNRCEADIDECAQSICKNGGTCNNILGHYNCACASGWLGDDCQYMYPSCNHTCSLDAVILNQAIYEHNTTAQCAAGDPYAPNEDLLTVCCNLTNKRTWLKGDRIQVSNVCEERRIPLYTPIAAFNGTSLIDDSAGIFYGCVKDRQSGFLVILQGCRAAPHLLQVDHDSNSYFVIY